MMWGNGYGMGWWMWLLMAAGTLTFWIAVVLVVRALLRPGIGRGAAWIAPIR